MDELTCRHGLYFVFCEDCAPCDEHQIHDHRCEEVTV